MGALPGLAGFGALLESPYYWGAAICLDGDQARAGVRSSQPSASSSAKAFHMPTKPVPPPVG